MRIVPRPTPTVRLVVCTVFIILVLIGILFTSEQVGEVDIQRKWTDVGSDGALVRRSPLPSRQSVAPQSGPLSGPVAGLLTAADEGPPRREPVWSPKECMRGTLLQHAKLRKSCKEGPNSGTPVERRFCQEWERSSSPVCGQFASGVFAPSVVMPQNNPIVAAYTERCNHRELDAMFRDVVSDPHALSFADKQRHSASDEARQLEVKLPEFCGDFEYFDRWSVVKILYDASIGSNGQGILFTGDSMVRQLMLRIVSYLRGQEYFSEHYFHQDGLYVMRKDGDSLVVLDSAGKGFAFHDLQRYFPGYLSPSEAAALQKQQREPQPSSTAFVALMFQWETKPSVYRREFLRMPHVPLHVAAFMYWWQNKDPLTEIDEYLGAVEQLAQSEEAYWALRPRRKSYVFVTTPWTDPGLFGGVEAPTRLSRNAKLTSWIRRLREKESLPGHVGTRWSLLDFAGLAEVEHMPKTKDGIHYMCIWTPKFPNTIKMQKYNYQNCTDPMGLAVVQWFVHALAVGGAAEQQKEG